jgi:hypothetical protein
MLPKEVSLYIPLDVLLNNLHISMFLVENKTEKIPIVCSTISLK